MSKIYNELNVTLRLSAICKHHCWICLQEGNHFQKQLDLEAVRLFSSKLKEFAAAQSKRLVVSISGIGESLNHPKFREFIEIGYEMGAQSLILQTSGFDNKLECDNLRSVSEIAWQKHRQHPWSPFPFMISPAISNNKDILDRIERLIKEDFPVFQLTRAHNPDLSWDGTLEEVNVFDELIKRAGFSLVEHRIPPKIGDWRQRQFEDSRVYKRGEAVLWTLPSYILPMGQALKHVKRFVWTPVGHKEDLNNLHLCITEEGRFSPCSLGTMGFSDIRDPGLNLDQVAKQTKLIKSISNELIKSNADYQAHKVHKCTICPLRLKEMEDIVSKATLEWYEENAAESKTNGDGSVTFTFDEPGTDPATGRQPTSTTTISKEDYEAAKEDPRLKV